MGKKNTDRRFSVNYFCHNPSLGGHATGNTLELPDELGAQTLAALEGFEIGKLHQNQALGSVGSCIAQYIVDSTKGQIGQFVNMRLFAVEGGFSVGGFAISNPQVTPIGPYFFNGNLERHDYTGELAEIQDPIFTRAFSLWNQRFRQQPVNPYCEVPIGDQMRRRVPHQIVVSPIPGREGEALILPAHVHDISFESPTDLNQAPETISKTPKHTVTLHGFFASLPAERQAYDSARTFPLPAELVPNSFSKAEYQAILKHLIKEHQAIVRATSLQVRRVTETSSESPGIKGLFGVKTVSSETHPYGPLAWVNNETLRETPESMRTIVRDITNADKGLGSRIITEALKRGISKDELIQLIDYPGGDKKTRIQHPVGPKDIVVSYP